MLIPLGAHSALEVAAAAKYIQYGCRTPQVKTQSMTFRKNNLKMAQTASSMVAAGIANHLPSEQYVHVVRKGCRLSTLYCSFDRTDTVMK
jgi:hypothetical protein